MDRLHRPKPTGAARLSAGDLGRTQFGTPLTEVLFARAEYDPLKWLYIPIAWGDDTQWSGPAQWAEKNGPRIWALWQELNAGVPEPETTAIARTVVEPRSYAEKYGGFRPEDPFEIITYLHLPSPTVLALPVRVFVDDQPDMTAAEAAGANTSDTIDPPRVENFSNPTLGTGLKVTAHRILPPDAGTDADEGAIWVQVRYAFKIPDKQAVVTVTASATDLGRMAGAQDDLDAFVRTITVKHIN